MMWKSLKTVISNKKDSSESFTFGDIKAKKEYIIADFSIHFLLIVLMKL